MASNLPLSQGSPAPELSASVLPVINYAMQQNGAAAIQSVTIENPTDAALERVTLRIAAAPEFALTLTRHIDRIPAHQSVRILQPKLLLNSAFLGAMTEKVTGVLRMTLEQDGAVLAACHVETTVLAFDQWHGLELYPELLAAFVTPNHPALARVLARAAAFLGQWTGDGSLDGYQSQDPNRVLSQGAAVFAALRELGVAYVNPPASFEQAGQRVRLSDQVVRQKLGTCLDLALLYASCLEAVGLHPLLIASPSHIFAGVWLEEKMFPESVQDDFSLVTKRLAAGIQEIAVVETTFVTQDGSFDDARKKAEEHMNRLPIAWILDVHRARMSHIVPLPQRVQDGEAWTVEHDARPSHQAAPAQLGDPVAVEAHAREESIPKKVQWERKLLDLGLRNSLINLRMTKTLLPLLTGSLDELENALADGSEYTILPRPADLRATELTFETLYEASEAEGIVQAEFRNRRLRSVLTEAELGKSIKELYRTAKTALEENGANTLYLALGLLRWFENKRSTKARYAPIILIPIEMVRKSAAQGYVIRLREEEPQINVTMLEKLKQDFGILITGLDPLPTDEHGIDIRRVLTVLRKAVMEQTHWDVLETAAIGIFSFSQFVMWNDIRNRTQDLLHNKVVRSLMDGKLCWDAQPLELGSRVREDNVLLPMSADASQLYAIQTACQGESFVLHGPPGTGKSQTITSLIANALAQGRSVLFVAEKMAALEVVQKRLERIGIGPFCLELHSNKSKKKDVLEQLRRACEVTKTCTSQEYADKAAQLAHQRALLDDYARELHKPLACGSDLHELLNDYEQVRNAAAIAPFAPDAMKNRTKAQLEQQLAAVERMLTAARVLGSPREHPLRAVGCTRYSQSLRSGVRPVTEEYLAQVQSLRPWAETLAPMLGLEAPAGFDELRRLEQLARQLECWQELPSAWAKAADPQRYFREVARLCAQALEAERLKGQLLERFDPGVLTLDGQELQGWYAEDSSKWFLSRLMGLNRLTKLVNTYAKAPVDRESLGDAIALLRDYQAQARDVQELLDGYAQDLGSLYTGDDTDWRRIAALAQTAQASAQAVLECSGSLELLRRCGGDLRLKSYIQGLSRALPEFLRAKAAFDGLLGVVQNSRPDWLEGQEALCRTIVAHADQLKEWTAYAGAVQEVKALGLDHVAAYCEADPQADVLSAYRKALLEALICAAIDDSATLNQFSGAVFDQQIEHYRRLDRQWTGLSQQEIYCRLASKVPNFIQEAAQSSELGILQRCIKSGGRGTSIRRLFEQIPNLLPRLCPCMLMSPISAAQYLDPKRGPFDIVVFDEASQLPTCKAVGVLARGVNAVVVGDPKQMPPTSFFSTNAVDEDNLEVEDLESILDDCLALNMPQSHLLWHYRSRHESLIAFSNRQFYENKLLTFPSVNDRQSKVGLVYVEGVFDRGKTRTNRAEAQAVVEEIRRRFADPERSRESLGVVTFNISQQHLIDDLLGEACARDEALERWVYGSEEPVFIKNLENVQGDERDVILFSVGFGPDSSGKVSMNFGPLNRDGGWRRLNVAVTRSRCEMLVFSTLRPEQLDLSRTKAQGVAALRSFLEYAGGKTAALEEAQLPSCRTDGPGIAQAISKALAEAGYETDLGVGRSGYRMDVGVVDPADPQRYLLGILLDGDGYGNARTTRDREIAQAEVLKGLGWNLLRLWSMDWWDNRDKELGRILDTLGKLQSGASTKPRTPDAPEPPRLRSKPTAPRAKKVKTPQAYKAAVLTPGELTAEQFVEPRYRKELQKRIAQVIDTEAPVSQTVLVKRVVQSFGIARAGSRIQAHMAALLESTGLQTTAQEEVRFYWSRSQDPETYVGYRVNGEGESRRDVRDVPVQEVANAVCAVLHEQVSMAQEDLLRETAKKLGYTRLGGNVLSQLDQGIRYAETRQNITLGQNDAYVLTDQGAAKAEAAL